MSVAGFAPRLAAQPLEVALDVQLPVELLVRPPVLPFRYVRKVMLVGAPPQWAALKKTFLLDPPARGVV
ncbi:hypothetical protein [Sorangium sp. So ce204]|uniref:hypothetical protein n=1 Tax=Sorangium sp. So ce204 TaxID=3133288 RepID=UPI003F5DB659